MPAKYDDFVESITHHNKNFKHCRWDERTLREECVKLGPEVADRFDKLGMMIQKIDFGRYVSLKTK